MIIQNEKLAVIYSYGALFRACFIDMNSKIVLSDGMIIGGFPKWISKNFCLGTAFVKDFETMYAKDIDRVMRVGDYNEDSNLIIEYYLHL